MTQCIGSPAQEMAELYLAGELPESEVERFENHYFGCDRCHEYLRTLIEVREVLGAKPIAVPSPAAATSSGPAPLAQRPGLFGRVLAFPVPVAIFGSLAAAVLAIAVLIGVQRSSPPLQPGHQTSSTAAPSQPVDANQVSSAASGASGSAPASAKSGASQPPAAQAAPPATELAELADLKLPGYQQAQLRGDEPADADHAAFTAGMQAYVQGDCSQTQEDLAKVSAASPDSVPANLYSGLCQLQDRDLAQAEANFSAVASDGDTPQLETAEYFLAQTLLLRGDATGAAHWLERTAALHGDYEDRASQQLAKLRH